MSLKIFAAQTFPRRAIAGLAVALWLGASGISPAHAADAAVEAVEPAASTVTIQDARGRSVTLSQPPQRIVSLLPSLTESVCALGACERLVGVDRYSRYPETVAQLPEVGGGIDPNIEAIARLRPDVVLAATSSRAAFRLESLGIAVVALEPQTEADVQHVLGALAQLLQLPDARAQQVWRDIDAGVNAAAQAMPASMRGARVYFEVSSGPFAAGEASFIGQMLQRLGLGNIVAADMGPFPKLNPEFVLRADPDLIMVGDRSMQASPSYPGWQNMRAIRQGRVCRFNDAQADILVRPGPRMAEAAQLMLRCAQDKATAP